MRKLLSLVLVTLVVGACGSALEKPASYAGELAVCLETSSSWAEYTPCCERVAAKYGRDGAFCHSK